MTKMASRGMVVVMVVVVAVMVTQTSGEVRERRAGKDRGREGLGWGFEGEAPQTFPLPDASSRASPDVQGEGKDTAEKYYSPQRG